jgi:hypothetical protein
MTCKTTSALFDMHHSHVQNQHYISTTRSHASQPCSKSTLHHHMHPRHVQNQHYISTSYSNEHYINTTRSHASHNNHKLSLLLLRVFIAGLVGLNILLLVHIAGLLSTGTTGSKAFSG